MGAAVELVLEPLSDRFEPADDRWLGQVTGLVGELRREVGGVTRAGEPVPGSKGMVESIVLSLVSAGSLTAFVELVKSWLARDRTRSLKVSWSEGGDIQAVELSGSGVDGEAFDDLLRAVSARVTAE